ncbi:MAG: DUF4405 domain-containing protein [Methanothrix sp.]|jgi:hypothetical protein|nr:MAG: hypothetical protein APR56_02470 [Methanosaeta sp. SDB]MCP1392960.1 DUF4405 domain-containing protein [Methanothrix harundinacea]MDD2637770.1 DUF4405 domain-containing protein [Methanothrix sp.]MDI9399270.1 DUF4405 domain-containing protein [Euryarchaeota archaeon]MDD3709892.1 DUF4405 domain-containing protein [Methanothrix sp.]
MNRTALNLLVDVISFISFLASTASGLVLWQVLPGGYGFRGGRPVASELLFLDLSRQEWLALHNWTSLMLAVLIILHVALHRRWIRNYVGMIGRSQ